jgi:hypothetical protein
MVMDTGALTSLEGWAAQSQPIGRWQRWHLLSRIDAILFSDAGLKQHGDPIADYDAVLKINPKYADSLYGRGVAKLKKGDNDGGNSDIASAKAIKPDIADDFIRYGVR